MTENLPLPQSALELIDFPSRFQLKVIGTKSKEFEVAAIALVKARCPADEQLIVSSKESKTGKYTSLSLTFTAYSQRQLVDIYQDLYDCEHVVMSL
jgi:putative lipoic acid-binding regulatory protein